MGTTAFEILIVPIWVGTIGAIVAAPRFWRYRGGFSCWHNILAKVFDASGQFPGIQVLYRRRS